MPSLVDLRLSGILPTSKLMKKLLYGENSYYGSNVNFSTTESKGDFATHATTGKALALLIAHKMHEIYVQEYEKNSAEQPFVCHELSGGNGQLAHDILNIIKIMAEDEALKSTGQSWTNLWKNLQLRTFEISEKLSAEQNAKSQKFNDEQDPAASPTNARYQSINKKASKKQDDELVYLTFSNEIFDALPVDVIYRSAEDQTRLLMQFCIPIVPKENLELLGIDPLPVPEEYIDAPVEGLYADRQEKLSSGECVIPPADAIPRLTDVEYIPFFMPLDNVTDLKYKEDIKKYVLSSGLAPGRLTCYSAPFVKLLKVLSNKKNLHHMHFDYFNTFMPQFKSSSNYFRQYPADVNLIHDESPHAFTFSNQSVDITYNPDLHMAANIFAANDLDFSVAHQAAPYILQSQDFAQMMEVLRNSKDPELGGDRIIKDAAKFIADSSSDFKFFEAASKLPQQKYTVSTLSPLSTPADAPAEVASYGIAGYSPFMSPCYDMETFLHQDPLGKTIATVTDTQHISDLCNKFNDFGNRDQLTPITAALRAQPLLLNKKIVIDGKETTPWKFLMLDPNVGADTIAALLERSGGYIPDFFARDDQSRLLVENSEIDLAKRQPLIDVLKLWQYCLHNCIRENFVPGIQHLSKLYKDPEFSAFQLSDTYKLINEFPQLHLELSPIKFAKERGIDLRSRLTTKPPKLSI